MDAHRQNAKWLRWFAPFHALPVSAAYLSLFFLEKGLSLSEILALQTIFSIAVVVWEVPSGYFADRFGRAFSIKLSAPLAAGAMLAYAVGQSFWWFALCELLLAVADGLISGADTALLFDSLKSDGQADEFARRDRQIRALGYFAPVAGAPVAFALAHWYGVSSTVIADGLLIIVGMIYAYRLVEAPRSSPSQAGEGKAAWRALTTLSQNARARWLITLTCMLSTATYFGFWLATPYYLSLHLRPEVFGLFLAIRSAFKAILSHFYKGGKNRLVACTVIAGLVYLAMAAKQWWLLPAVLGHDIVQALHAQPIVARLNQQIDDRHRAMLNSAVNLTRRLTYAGVGPLCSLLIAQTSLQTSLVIMGASFSLVAAIALLRLRQLGTFA